MPKFTGPLIDCVKDFAKCIGKNYAYRNLLAQTLKVNNATMHKWFDQLNLPQGVNLLKLKIVLELNGYQTSRLQKIHPTVKGFGELIALGLLSLDDATREIKVSKPQNVFRIVFGRGGTTEEKLTLMEAAIKRFASEAKEILRKWKETVVLMDEKTITGNISYPPPQLLPEVKPNGKKIDGRKKAIEGLAFQVKAMLPLAELVASDDFTPADRERLRELAGKASIFELKNLLFQLCGERARNNLTERQ